MDALRDGNPGMRRPSSEPVAVYTYTDAKEVAWEKARFERNGEKWFCWRRSGVDGWPKGKSGVLIESLNLLGANELDLNPDSPVIVVEGEEKRRALAEAGFLAVCAAGGSSQKKFGKALEILRGRIVYLWADNDDPGEKYMQTLAHQLGSVAAEVLMVRWNEAPPAGDAHDALRQGVDVQALLDAATPIYMVNSSTSEDGHLNQPGPVLVRLADVEREEVQWRWQHRIPTGKLTLVEGDPDTGKTFMTMALATAATRGTPLPGDYGRFDAFDVLILTAEDGLGDTIRPRLEDMGADLNRVHALTSIRDFDGTEHFPNLKEDLLMLESALAGGNFGMIIIDPINAYLGGVDGNRDTDIRSVLGPLAAIAERYNVAVVAVRHLTKGGRDKAIYRGLGGIGYTAAARSVLLVGKNPNHPTERVVVCIKHNLAPRVQRSRSIC